MKQITYIPDIFADVVAKASVQLARPVYFDFGHYADVTRNLHFKDISETQKADKYPLVWLVMDFEERQGRNPSVYAEIAPMIIIATDTEANYTMDERRVNTFLPILYPIYAALMNQISRSPMFGMPSLDSIVHTKIDRPYWAGGTNAQTGANIFNDHVDAIQITNLQLKVKQKCI